MAKLKSGDLENHRLRALHQFRATNLEGDLLLSLLGQLNWNQEGDNFRAINLERDLGQRLSELNWNQEGDIFKANVWGWTHMVDRKIILGQDATCNSNPYFVFLFFHNQQRAF